MSESTRQRSITTRQAQYPRPWYEAARTEFNSVIVRRRGTRLIVVLWYVAALGGVVLALFGQARPPGVPALVIAVVLVAALSASLARRWTWPWQREVVREGQDLRRWLKEILGPQTGRDVAEAWLVHSPEAPVYDRYRILSLLVRYEEAERLIAELPTETPLDQFRGAWAELGRRWRLNGEFNIEDVVEILPQLGEADRRRAAGTIACWQGMTQLAQGRDLRDIPAPEGPPLRLIDEARIWRIRLWPVQWFVAMYLLTWVGLAILRDPVRVARTTLPWCGPNERGVVGAYPPNEGPHQPIIRPRRQ